MKKLSAYTHARYCSDITDIRSGIDEIHDSIGKRIRENRSIPYFYYLRLSKLRTKLNKLSNH